MRMFNLVAPQEPATPEGGGGRLVAFRDGQGRLRRVDAASTVEWAPYREVDQAIRDLAALIARKRR